MLSDTSPGKMSTTCTTMPSMREWTPFCRTFNPQYWVPPRSDVSNFFSTFFPSLPVERMLEPALNFPSLNPCPRPWHSCCKRQPSVLQNPISIQNEKVLHARVVDTWCGSEVAFDAQLSRHVSFKCRLAKIQGSCGMERQHVVPARIRRATRLPSKVTGR